MKLPRIITALLLSAVSARAASDQLVYVGTYTSGKSTSKGIYVYGLDSKTGEVEPMGLAAESKSPSFLAIAPNKKFLYAVSEGGGNEGGVSSFSIDQSTGKLTFLNQQSSQGAGPCHVSVDPAGKVLMVANYGSGHVASLPIKSDGSLGEAASSHLQGPASNINPRRQAGPHAHSINPDKAGKFAFACDLGCDKVFIYKLDPASAKLTPNDPAFASVPAGGGPRHFAFHPGGRFAWANNEMTLTVTGFTFDAAGGGLTPIETVSTLPAGRCRHTRLLHRRDTGASEREVRLRLQPRPRHHRLLPRRSVDRPAHLHRSRAEPGQGPAKLRHRPDRAMADRRGERRRRHRGFRDRPGLRKTQADGPAARGGCRGVREVPAALIRGSAYEPGSSSWTGLTQLTGRISSAPHPANLVNPVQSPSTAVGGMNFDSPFDFSRFAYPLFPWTPAGMKTSNHCSIPMPRLAESTISTARTSRRSRRSR